MLGTRGIRATFGGTLLLAALLWASVSGASAAQNLTVQIRDDCDPATFNAVLGLGTCIGNGDTTLQEFFAEVTQDHKVGAWHLDPDSAGLNVGETLQATNRGGERHTFTRVAAFGGGVVPILNQLSGNPVMAPECGSAVRIPPLPAPASTTPPVMAGSAALPVGPNLFQCCIHPWTRTAITVKRS